MNHHDKECHVSNKQITSESLAIVIIDALIDSNIVKQQDFDKAVKIAIEEIDVRKAMNAW